MSPPLLRKPSLMGWLKVRSEMASQASFCGLVWVFVWPGGQDSQYRNHSAISTGWPVRMNRSSSLEQKSSMTLLTRCSSFNSAEIL